MSFGFSVGDFVTVPTLAWQIYKSCKDSSDDYKSLSSDVASLHIVLKESLEHIQEHDVDAARQEQLALVGKNCRDVLVGLEARLTKYASLGTQSQRTWDRMRWGMEDVSRLREQIVCSTANLTALNTAITNSSQARIEKKLNQLLAEIRAGKRENSIVSIQTIESLSSEDQEAWVHLRTELEDLGIGTSLFLQHRKFIVAWFQTAVATGALQEDGPQYLINARTMDSDATLVEEMRPPPPLIELYPRPLIRDKSLERTAVKKAGRIKRAMKGLNFRMSFDSKTEATKVRYVIYDDHENTSVGRQQHLTKYISQSPTQWQNRRVSEHKEDTEGKTSYASTSSSMISSPPPSPDHVLREEILPVPLLNPRKRSATFTPRQRDSGKSDAPSMSVYDGNHRRSFPKERSLQERRRESAVGKKLVSQSDWQPSHQNVYDTHGAIMTQYFERTAAQKAKMEQARQSLNLGTRPLPVSKSALPFHKLASSGMEIPLPSPGSKGLLSMKELEATLDVKDREGENFIAPKIVKKYWTDARLSDLAPPKLTDAIYVPPNNSQGENVSHLETEDISAKDMERFRRWSDPAKKDASLSEVRKRELMSLLRYDGTLKPNESLELKSKINSIGNGGSTYLHEACKHGISNVIPYLLNQGADIRIKDYDDRTALHVAIASQNVEVIAALLESIPVRSIPELWYSNILHTAIKDGNLDMAKLLLLHGADVDRKDERGMTALHLASGLGMLPIVELLIRLGASINPQGDCGETPLHDAALRGQSTSITTLMNFGADVNAEDSVGVRPLHLAIKNGHADAAKCLIDQGVDVNLPDLYGETPLHKAAAAGEPKAAELLLEADAHVEIVNSNGATALLLAVTHRHLSVVQLLIEHGADVNSTDSKGTTPIYVAVEDGDEELVSLLLDAGADPSIAVSGIVRHGTPLELAKLRGYTVICFLLKSHLALSRSDLALTAPELTKELRLTDRFDKSVQAGIVALSTC